MKSESSLSITADRHVFLNGVEVPRCLGVNINIEAGKDPEIMLRVSVERIDIDGYSDYWQPSK